MSYDAYIGFGVEADWGDPLARTQFARVYEDSAPDHEAPISMVTTMGQRDSVNVFKTTEKGSINVVQPLLYDGMDLALYYAMGSLATSGASDPYTHLYTLGENVYTRGTAPLTGLTIEAHLGLSDSGFESYLLSGGRCRSMGMSIKVDEEIKVTTDWVGKQLTQVAKTVTPTYPVYDTETVHAREVVVALDEVDTPVYGIDFTISNNLRDDKALLGSSYIAEPRAIGKREISGTIELPYADKGLYDKFIAATSVKITVTCTGTGTRSTIIELPSVKLTGKTPGFEEGEEQDYSLPFTALYDAVNGALTITQINASSTPVTPT
jgi:hypothetical protein